MTEHNPESLPNDLPEPEDDGKTDHLPGTLVPSLSLRATDGTQVNLAELSGRVIVYCFPKMGRSADEADPDGWAAIPGAYGCTQEACSFRDHYQDLKDLGITNVFGLSLQTRDHQRDARSRVNPQFEFLSDADQEFTRTLQLPTFEVEDEVFNKRLTLVLSDGRIEHVFYPVFPPDNHADEVITWLENHPK